MSLKSFVKAIVIVALVAGVTEGCTKAPPGNVGIKVNNYGSQRGVQDFPIHTGAIWYNPFTEDVYTFPTSLQTKVWTKDPNEGSPNDESISFNSIEGARINADVAISYQFEAAKVPEVFVTFRQDPDTITNVYVRSRVRNAINEEASTMKAIDIIGAGKEKLQERVTKELDKELGSKGIHIDMISFTGDFRMDPLVHDSINKVIQASQAANQAEQKVRQSQAEAQQKIAAANGEAQSILLTAQAQAKANDLIGKSLTPEVIQFQAVQKWRGQLPQVTGSGGVPLINLNPNTK